jgi:Uma2 family endonuclease
MSSATLISVGEYLKTSYRPDCDYVDGEVKERNLGEFDHATLQAAIVAWFYGHKREWSILVVPEQRTQVSSTRFRIPDVAILPSNYSKHAIVRIPPIVCIEILSKDDTLRSIRERVDDYLNFGVKNVWILDPLRRDALIADQSGYHAPQGDELAISETPIYLPLKQIFAELD